MATEQRIQLPWLLSTVLARYRLTDAFSPTMYLAAGVCREMTALIRVVYSREVQQDLPGV